MLKVIRPASNPSPEIGVSLNDFYAVSEPITDLCPRCKAKVSSTGVQDEGYCMYHGTVFIGKVPEPKKESEGQPPATKVNGVRIKL